MRSSPRSPSRLLPSRRARSVLAALALLTAGRGAAAQGTPVLSDADVPALVALLGAQAARAEAMHGRAADVAREVQAELAALQVDAADPLGYVRARTAHYLVPPDARYDAACSRAVSGYMMLPRAIFAIGRPDGETVAALRQKGTTRLSNQEMSELMGRQQRGAAGQAQAATTRFYQARGFRISGTVGEAAPLAWGGPSPDPFAITVHLTNVVATMGRDCAALGNTALLVLSIDETIARSAGRGAAQTARANPVAQADDAFDATLARVGMTGPRYNDLLGALWQAQKEIEDPQEAAQTDAMARIPDMRAMADARRQNRAWLQRHRDDVLPALERLARSLGGARDR